MKKPSSWNGRKIDIVIEPVVNCFQILYIRSLNTMYNQKHGHTLGCELLSDFVYSFFEHNIWPINESKSPLWIAFRFCIFVLWTQFGIITIVSADRCELLSDFVYSFFEHNPGTVRHTSRLVVNCFQILYIRSLNTITLRQCHPANRCELLSDFVYSFFEHNWTSDSKSCGFVVNCFQILYIRSLNTILPSPLLIKWSCELLSDFVYSFFEHNIRGYNVITTGVVNCFQILYIRSLNTISSRGKISSRWLWIAFRFCIFVLWTQSQQRL